MPYWVDSHGGNPLEALKREYYLENVEHARELSTARENCRIESDLAIPGASP